MGSPPSRVSRGPSRPTKLGRWEVIAKIAGGGMSAIYLGRRVDPAVDASDPPVVALKIIRHDVRQDDRVIRMFLDEGQLLERLVHPNVVRTLEVGNTDDQAYIAMELLLGSTFAAVQDAVVARGVRLHPHIAAWTAARIADALHYAHEVKDERGAPLGLIHRDVNPQNVFATFSGEVKLFDFGMAKVDGVRSAKSTPNIVVGKIPYLSPEQIMQLPLDRRSDIFALGTTLWELLTAARLFRRDTDGDTLRAVHVGPIPDPREVAPEVPAELARICKRALERNREHRFPNADELSRHLDAFLASQRAVDVPGRLKTLLDTLFPGEQKRQTNWLKPAITAPRTSVPPPAPSSKPSLPPSSRKDPKKG